MFKNVKHFYIAITNVELLYKIELHWANLLKIIKKLQLEAKLYNAELQDATQTEKWEKTRDRLHRAREVLEAQVVQYCFPFSSSPSNILMQIKI